MAGLAPRPSAEPMAISSTYGVMQSQIADELGDRQELNEPLADSGLALSPIQNAIQSAIAFWERQPFYFNDLVLQTPLAAPVGGYQWRTANNQEYYTATDYAGITTMPKIRKLWVLVNSNRYALNERTAQYLDEISVNPATTGEPVDYAYSGLMVRMYPIPNGAYPVGVEATQRAAALVNVADTNYWTQDGYDLTKSMAKLILAREVLFDAEIAAAMTVAVYGDPNSPEIRGYLWAVQAETTRRKGRGRIRPTHF